MKRSTYDPVKRFIDVVISGLALLLLSPVQVIVALLVKRSLDSPVLFRQPRPGKDQEIFKLIKFRTMLRPDPDCGLVTDSERLTRLGALLRSASLDELPTLWNVLGGDMSLVGPRPLLVRYLDRYDQQQLRRHEVRPGITGLAQVSGRNAITWEEKLAKDTEYVDHRSLSLDTRILCRTLAQVLRQEGISAEGEATMTEFLGSTHG